ncbi:hypothetical protein BE20_25000 [Sorangium cellulosum]|uniref:Uncharacterized protein n=1 Tax=Sorangium cellulosum TaxID=56 RepID=A0A150S5Y5_SORCE|nr:hypothetical protein BE20_25000 [Sorangium cellulosum]KYF89259.1 hypothetical protein BE18_22770 [Sorangium cellulosum]
MKELSVCRRHVAKGLDGQERERSRSSDLSCQEFSPEALHIFFRDILHVIEDARVHIGIDRLVRNLSVGWESLDRFLYHLLDVVEAPLLDVLKRAAMHCGQSCRLRFLPDDLEIGISALFWASEIGSQILLEQSDLVLALD